MARRRAAGVAGRRRPNIVDDPRLVAAPGPRRAARRAPEPVRRPPTGRWRRRSARTRRRGPAPRRRRRPGCGLVPGGASSRRARISATADDHALLGLEVVEHGLVGDAGRRGDRRQRDVLERLREEQLHRARGRCARGWRRRRRPVRPSCRCAWLSLERHSSTELSDGQAKTTAGLATPPAGRAPVGARGSAPGR